MIFKRKIFKLFFSFLLIGSGAFLFNSSIEAQNSSVLFIQLQGDTINPVTADYITKAIHQAEEQQAEALVIKLNTPGGLLSSTRTIVQNMLQAKVPLVVYVAPGGAHAGSAGVFITYASHIAAMAPSTNIGAAHPVTMGPGSTPSPKGGDWQELKDLVEDLKAVQEKQKSKDETISEEQEENQEQAKMADAAEEELVPDADPMGSKILQDTVAFIKSIAKARNRNVEWAIESVTKSASITDEEALEKQVVEIIAESDEDLLEQLHGRSVEILDTTVQLNTTNAAIQYLEMSAAEKFFNTLADPNIAYFLLILGFYGLMFEITHPGFGLPGILGAIFLILAFYSMQTLPTNYAGVALVVFGLILLIAEVYTPTFGLFSLGGLACLVLGSLLLFDSVDPMMRVSKLTILTAVGTIAGLTFFLLGYLVRSQRNKVIGGQEGMIGAKGEVRSISEDGAEYKVFVHGELWTATSEQPLNIKDQIVVQHMDGMNLIVHKISTHT